MTSPSPSALFGSEVRILHASSSFTRVIVCRSEYDAYNIGRSGETNSRARSCPVTVERVDSLRTRNVHTIVQACMNLYCQYAALLLGRKPNNYQLNKDYPQLFGLCWYGDSLYEQPLIVRLSERTVAQRASRRDFKERFVVAMNSSNTPEVVDERALLRLIAGVRDDGTESRSPVNVLIEASSRNREPFAI